MSETTSLTDFSKLARKIRRHTIRLTHRAKSSHIGTSLSMTDLLAVLYGGILRVNPAEPHWPDRDRFILSKGHGAAAEGYLSLINREAVQAIVPTCQELGVGVFAYGPFAQGFLTGKYAENSVFDSSDRRHRLKHFQPEQRPKFIMILERLREIACQAGKTPA